MDFTRIPHLFKIRFICAPRMEKKQNVQNHKRLQAFHSKVANELNKKLGPEYISYRAGHGMREVAYLEGWAAISIANQIFGYNNWSSEIKKIDVDFSEEKDGKFLVGVSALVRVSLRNGSFHEDIGSGSSEGHKSKCMAFEKAKKEAVTDALKRALRQFGNALGNSLYDREFLKEIKKIEKRKQAALNVSDLLRKTGVKEQDLCFSMKDDDLNDAINAQK